MESEPNYHSYLLRLRYIDDPKANGRAWRISLQGTSSQEEIFFATLDAMMIYLTG